MQLNTKVRRIGSIVVVVALVMFMASCSTSKKYGCPNHIQIPAISSLLR